MNNDKNIITDENLLSQIINNIENKIPSSFIRKGDGENIVVGYQKIDSIKFKDFKHMMRIMNIRLFNLNFQRYVKNELVKSFTECDVLGISKLNQRYGHWAIEDEVLSKCKLEHKIFCDMNFHMNFVKYPNQSLIKNSLVRQIISKRKIGVISCFNVEDTINLHQSNLIKWIEMPKQKDKLYNKKINQKFYNSVISQIKAYNSQIDFWLIAAGIHGKIFCNVVKINSGIAIDIGSSIDSWVDNYKSRGYLKEIKENFSL